MMIIREIRDVRAKVGPFVGVCNGSQENREACVLSSRARTRKREAECVMNDPRGCVRACLLSRRCASLFYNDRPCAAAPLPLDRTQTAASPLALVCVEFAFTSRARYFTVLPTSPEMKNLSRERDQ